MSTKNIINSALGKRGRMAVRAVKSAVKGSKTRRGYLAVKALRGAAKGTGKVGGMLVSGAGFATGAAIGHKLSKTKPGNTSVQIRVGIDPNSGKVKKKKEG